MNELLQQLDSIIYIHKHFCSRYRFIYKILRLTFASIYLMKYIKALISLFVDISGFVLNSIVQPNYPLCSSS